MKTSILLIAGALLVFASSSAFGQCSSGTCKKSSFGGASLGPSPQLQGASLGTGRLEQWKAEQAARQQRNAAAQQAYQQQVAQQTQQPQPQQEQTTQQKDAWGCEIRYENGQRVQGTQGSCPGPKYEPFIK